MDYGLGHCGQECLIEEGVQRGMVATCPPPQKHAEAVELLRLKRQHEPYPKQVLKGFITSF